MKKLIYILSIAAVASLTVLSCQKEQEVNPRTPSPAEVAGCYGVYFPTQEASGDHVYSPLDDPEIEITVARTNDSGAITVPVTITYSEDGIFVPQDIKFADGQKETTIKVRFDKAKEGVNYKASFTIEDNQYASLYNSNPVSIDFSVLRVEMKDFLNPKTGEPAVFTFTHNWSGSRGEGHATMKYYEVDGIRTCFFTSIDKDDAQNPVGLWHGDPCADLSVRWYVADQPSVYKPGTKCSHTNSEGNDFVEIVTQYIGFDYNGGDWVATPNPSSPINAYDWFWYWNMRGYSIDELYGSWLDDANIEGSPDEGYPLGYYDGNGGFFFQIYYYIPGLGGWKPDSYSNYFIADGFTRVDYSFELETDYPVGGKSPIYVEAGIDVAGIQYAIYEGELTATQVANKVAAIVEGTEASELFTDLKLDEEDAVKYATLEVSPETTGIYTFVAVAIDEAAEAQNSASVVFNYVSAEDEEEYAVDINVFTEDTPARYTALTVYDSFAFGLYGSDLTEVHMDIVESSKVTLEVFAELKSNSEYAVSDEILAQINAAGGFYDVVTDLDDDTEYAVIVWATNGYEDTFDYALHKTEEFPEVWKGIGKGSWTDDFFTTFYNVTPQTMEVDVEQSEDDPTRFRAIYPYDDKYPYNAPGDWDDTKSYDLVVSIPDETHVYIVPQKIGVDWGFGNVTIASTAGRYIAAGYSIEEIEAAGIKFGQFNDGVVTFPEENTLLIQLPDYSSNFYYANSNGAFAFVIPGANASAPAAAPAAVSFPKPYGIDGSCLIAAPEVKHVFQRDPQPVKTSVEATYTRKEKNADQKVLVSNKGFEVR